MFKGPAKTRGIHYEGKVFEVLYSRHYKYLNEKLKNGEKKKRHRDFKKIEIKWKKILSVTFYQEGSPNFLDCCVSWKKDHSEVHTLNQDEKTQPGANSKTKESKFSYLRQSEDQLVCLH